MDEKTGARPPLAVLVADDLEVNRRLALLLLRHLGCEADAAKGGREACEMAMRRAYDLILMDVQMPGVDGLEATRVLREHYGGGGPRIVAMTAGMMEGDHARCRAAGMDDYLAKPLSPQDLRAVIERATAPAAAVRLDASPGAPVVPDPDGPILDWSRLEGLRPYDDDGSLVTGVISEFLRDAPVKVKAIIAANAAGDAPRVATLAHGLRGMSANVGALALVSICRSIESCAALHKSDPALAQLAECVGSTCTALAAGPG